MGRWAGRACHMQGPAGATPFIHGPGLTRLAILATLSIMPSFKRLVRLAVCIAWAGSAAAEESAFFSVRGHPGYPAPEKSLESLVRARGGQRLNHFCVIGYRDPGGHDFAWVLWEEGKALILWEAVKDPSSARPLAASRRFLRLDRDVVATEEDLKGSTYLVTKAWLDKVTGDCDAHGDKLTISLPTAKRDDKTRGPNGIHHR